MTNIVKHHLYVFGHPYNHSLQVIKYTHTFFSC